MSADETKARILRSIAGSRGYRQEGRGKFRIGTTLVHIRYKSKASHGTSYPYNINPNTLRADYELWICGDRDGWYLIPISVIREMYEDPQAYVDRRHPEIRVATLDVASHSVIYGSGGQRISFSAYRNGHLPEERFGA